MQYCISEQFSAHNSTNNILDNNMMSSINIDENNLPKNNTEDKFRYDFNCEKNNEVWCQNNNVDRQDSTINKKGNAHLLDENQLLNDKEVYKNTQFKDPINKAKDNLEDQWTRKKIDKKENIAKNNSFVHKQNLNNSSNKMYELASNSFMDINSGYNTNMDIATLSSDIRDPLNNSLNNKNIDIKTRYPINDFNNEKKMGVKRESLSPHHEENMLEDLPNLEKINDTSSENHASLKYDNITNRRWYEDDGAIRTERVLLRPWLESLIEEGGVPGLEWLNRDEKIFKVPWKHRSKKTWSLKHCCVFLEWAHNTGRWIPGDPEPNYAQLKTRLRCAFSKAPDIEEMKNLHCSKTEEPYKVYRFIPKKDSKSHISCRRIRKFTPIMRKNAYNNRSVIPFNKKLKKINITKNCEKIVIKREISPGLINEIVESPCTKISKLTNPMPKNHLINEQNLWYSKLPVSLEATSSKNSTNSFIKNYSNQDLNNQNDDINSLDRGIFTGDSNKWVAFNEQQVHLPRQQPPLHIINQDENIFKVASYYCNMNQQQSNTRFFNESVDRQNNAEKIKSEDLQISPLTIKYDCDSNDDNKWIDKILPATVHKLPPLLRHSQFEPDLSSDDESYILPSVKSGSDYLKLKNSDDQLIPLIVVDGSGRKKCRPSVVYSDSEMQEDKSEKRNNLLPALSEPYTNNISAGNWFCDKVKEQESRDRNKTYNMDSDKKKELNNGSQKKYDFDGFVRNSVQLFDLTSDVGNSEAIKKYNAATCITTPLKLNSSIEKPYFSPKFHFFDKYTNIKNPGDNKSTKLDSFFNFENIREFEQGLNGGVCQIINPFVGKDLNIIVSNDSRLSKNVEEDVITTELDSKCKWKDNTGTSFQLPLKNRFKTHINPQLSISSETKVINSDKNSSDYIKEVDSIKVTTSLNDSYEKYGLNLKNNSNNLKELSPIDKDNFFYKQLESSQMCSVDENDKLSNFNKIETKILNPVINPDILTSNLKDGTKTNIFEGMSYDFKRMDYETPDVQMDQNNYQEILDLTRKATVAPFIQKSRESYKMKPCQSIYNNEQHNLVEKQPMINKKPFDLFSYHKYNQKPISHFSDECEKNNILTQEDQWQYNRYNVLKESLEHSRLMLEYQQKKIELERHANELMEREEEIRIREKQLLSMEKVLNWKTNCGEIMDIRDSPDIEEYFSKVKCFNDPSDYYTERNLEYSPTYSPSPPASGYGNNLNHKKKLSLNSKFDYEGQTLYNKEESLQIDIIYSDYGSADNINACRLLPPITTQSLIGLNAMVQDRAKKVLVPRITQFPIN